MQVKLVTFFQVMDQMTLEDFIELEDYTLTENATQSKKESLSYIDFESKRTQGIERLRHLKFIKSPTTAENTSQKVDVHLVSKVKSFSCNECEKSFFSGPNDGHPQAGSYRKQDRACNTSGSGILNHIPVLIQTNSGSLGRSSQLDTPCSGAKDGSQAKKRRVTTPGKGLRVVEKVMVADRAGW